MIITQFRLSSPTKKHLKDFTALIKELSPNRIVSEDQITYCIQRNHMFVAYDDKDNIVGMAVLIRVNLCGKTKGIIEDVVVAKEARGKGIGKSLIKKIIEFSKTEHYDQLELTSRPERREANTLYCSMDFQLQSTNFYRLNL